MDRHVGRGRRLSYKQIADDLLRQIADGRWEQGDRLPSEAELMNQYGVARGTVRSAIRELMTHGHVVTDQGRGTYIRKKPKVNRIGWQRFLRRPDGLGAFASDADTAGQAGDVEVIHVDRSDDPPEYVKDRLSLQQDELVLVRHRRFFLDGVPVQIATSYVPYRLAEGTRMIDENTGPGGLYSRLEDKGFELSHLDEVVSARMPGPAEERDLDLAPGVPIIRVVRVAYDRDGVPLELCNTIMASDRYELSYRLPAARS